MQLATLFQETRAVLKESSMQNTRGRATGTAGGSASKGKGRSRSGLGKTPLSRAQGRAQSSGWDAYLAIGLCATEMCKGEWGRGDS